ncbi:MAG: CocE/NonD family hydrolase [Xanthomonadales bacterium]|nr:CocE/NonD family hydrolase [Xanthomonadales bacterium]
MLHLRSAGAADSVFHSGLLYGEPSATPDIDRYVYDPLDTSKAERPISDDYIVDQSEVMWTDGDGLIYHSEPFAEPTEISGYLRFEAWLEMDVPDTDVNVTLYEILPDGTSIALTGETQRARYRDSLEVETLMTPGEIEHFVFERFYFFSRLIGKGSRLRLFIRPANGLAQQRNYNAGGVVAQETKADARTATVRLHLGPDTPTRLSLPVVDRD